MSAVTRPTKLDDYIGQEEIKKQLRVFIDSCKKRDDTLGHTLLKGPSGTGKTTLARIIANELDTDIIEMLGPEIKSQKQLEEIIRKVEQGTVLFIDEIHRISKPIQERFYSVLEDFKLSVAVTTENDKFEFEMEHKLEPFTVIGATTEAGKLSKPFRDRFKRDLRLRPYRAEELAEIVHKTASELNFQLTDEAALEVAKRSKKTPRVAKKRCYTIRDYACVRGDKEVCLTKVKEIFEEIGVAEYGLEPVEQKYLNILHESESSLALRTISDKLSESVQTIRDAIEPFMVQNNFIHKSSKGRQLTDDGKQVVRRIKND